MTRSHASHATTLPALVRRSIFWSIGSQATGLLWARLTVGIRRMHGKSCSADHAEALLPL